MWLEKVRFYSDKNNYIINPFMTEADIRANQWTGFYMISASIMKGLNERLLNKIGKERLALDNCLLVLT